MKREFSPLPLPEGARLHDTFQIVSRLAQGGMGEIYLASHTRLPGSYVVKVLSAEIVDRSNVYQRFKREAEITSSLRHPHIVQIVDFNVLPDGRPYMVMEHLQGMDLAARLHLEYAIAVPRVATIIDQISSGLTAAHNLGITHRDLKPANLFCVQVAGSEREFVKILDFGISKIKSATKLTAEKTLVGTPRYMSPEQAGAQTGEVDPLTDQFALAAIAYEMLCGRPAFDGVDSTELIRAVVQKNPQPLAKMSVALAPVDPVIRKALSKDKTQRYATIADFARAFEAAARQTPVVTNAAKPVVHSFLTESRAPEIDDLAKTISDKPKTPG